jgi:hypothetical protein
MSVSGPALRKAEFLCDFASVLLDHPEFPFLPDGDELHRKQVSLPSIPYAETPGSEQMLGSYTISPSLMIPSVFAAQGNASSLLLPVMASIATLAGSTHLFPPCICDQAQLLGQARLANQSPDRRPEPHLVCLARLVQDRSVGTHLERSGFVDSPTRGPPYLVRRRPRLLGRPLHRLGHHQASDRPSRKQARLCPCHPRLLARSMVDPYAILLVPPFTPASARPIDSTEYSIRLRLKQVRHLTLCLSVRSTTLMLCPARHPVRHPSHHSEPLL